MKLVITGALGHIGSRWIHTFRPGDFDEVVLVDNLATQRFASLFNLPAGVNFRLVEADVCMADLEAIFAGAHAVVHMAAITNAAGSFEIQDQVEQVNMQGTVRVAEACVATGARLVFLSTTSVYGTQEAVVAEHCSEDELKPQSPYASSKLRAEQLLAEMARARGLKFVTCRFGTIFGTSAGMRFHTAINKFCWQAVLGQPITVWRTALDQKRPYLGLGDAVNALSHILRSDLFDNQVYNVLTTNATVNDIIGSIRRHVPDLQIEHVDSRIMNQLSYTVSSEKFAATGFRSADTLEDGIARTIALLNGIRKTRTASVIG